MGSNFTLYVKHKGGSRESAEKAVTLLKSYLPPIIEKNPNFSGSDAILVDETTTPTLADTDVIVYMVRSIAKSVISAKGGNISMAEADGNVLGVTDLNLKICEVYFDRVFDGSPKELAGACYHETAHIKSNQDNAMHKGQNGFLKASPDYNGSPTDSNVAFMAKHLDRKVNMVSSY